MEISENQIIKECVAGNWDNFDQIYDQYLPKIYQFVFYRTRHKQTAEDLTSTIFIKVVQNLNSYRVGTSPFAAWIYRIARNAIIDHYRSSKSTLDLDAAFDISTNEDTAAKIDKSLKLEVVKKNLDKLSELQREVLTMRVWDELSHREIAEILEISEDSSKVAYSRALSNLKQTVEIK